MAKSTTPSEASKLLEAALLQMDGIIQGTKYDSAARESSLSGYDNGHGNETLTEALIQLQEAILRHDSSAEGPRDLLSPRDMETAKFIRRWLGDIDASSNGRNEDVLLKERDNLRLEISLLHQQLEEKNETLLRHEKLFQEKDDEERAKGANANLLMLNSELSHCKNEMERLEKENAELRKLCRGGRVPKYLPLTSPTVQGNERKHHLPASSPSDNDISPTEIPQSSPKKGSFRRMFHKIKRSNSGGNLEGNQSSRTSPPKVLQQKSHTNDNFVRNGLRATTAGRIGCNSSQVPTIRRPFARWTLDMIGIWMDSLGLGIYVKELVSSDIQDGQQLSELSGPDLESKLGMKKALHRKKMLLAISAKQETIGVDGRVVDAAGKLDHHWVTRWLDDVGLPQYKEAFLDARVDGRVLNVLTVDDLISELGISNLLHHLSIKHGIYVLRRNNFDPSYFKRRAVAGLDETDELLLWTNHRVMEWLKEVDLAEYAPNLRGSGVHGALMLNEQRFNDELLADLLSIPSNKSLLRRHLSIHFKTLVGSEVIHAKRNAEQDHQLPPLTPSTKARSKLKSSTSTFTLKRKKSKSHFDYEDLICPFSSRPVGSPVTKER